MIILQSKAKQGKSMELIKRFITDTKPATLITDELSLSSIYEKIKLLKQEGYVVNNETLNIEIMEFSTCEDDYYNMLQGRFTENLYLDIHLSRDAFENIKHYCKGIEREYGTDITIVEQLPANSKITGVNVVEEYY